MSRVALLVVTVFSSLQLWAEDGQSTLKASDVTPLAPSEDVDQILTNDQLRAVSGSKSRYSIASAFTYEGASLNKPLAKNKPNLSGTTGTTDHALLTGEISGQFNHTPVHAYFAGTGLRWITPLEASAPSDYQGDRLDMSNPYVGYQHIYNLAGLESVLDIRSVFYTKSDLVRIGYANALEVSQKSAFPLESVPLTLGFDFWTQVSRYNKKGPLGEPDDDFYMEDVREDQSDYGVGFEPYLEYAVTDHFDVSTQWALWSFEHVRSEPRALTFNTNKVTASIGLGYAVTRDIYVSPSVTFLVEDVRSDRTNASLSADINLF